MIFIVIILCAAWGGLLFTAETLRRGAGNRETGQKKFSSAFKSSSASRRLGGESLSTLNPHLFS